jgi:hypothetical protein
MVANAFCGRVDPTPVRGRMPICTRAPGHRGRCSWDYCGNTGGLGPDGGIHCERPREHRGLHRMTW